MQSRKIISTVLAAGAIVLYAIHIIILFYFGIATMLTTIFFYLSCLLILLGLLSLCGSFITIETFKNIRLSLIVFIGCLLLGDLSLRYIFKLHLTQRELTKHYYSSEYKRNIVDAALLKLIYGKKDEWFYAAPAGVTLTNSQEEFTYLHHHNSLGLRDKHSTKDIAKHNWIIGIGDSFTEGVGAPGDSTWPALLEHIIERDSAWNNLQVLNAGQPGSDVYYEYMLLTKLLPLYKPKAVILSLNTTDIGDIVIRGGFSRFQSDSTVRFANAPWWEPIYASSFIIRAIINNSLQPDHALIPLNKQQKVTNRTIDSIHTCLSSLSKLCSDKNCNLIVVFNPRPNEICCDSNTYKKLSSPPGKHTNFNIINLRDEYTATGSITKDNYKLYYWPKDGHHNSEGYRIFAEILVSHLKQNLKKPYH